MKKLISTILSVAMMATLFAGCGKEKAVSVADIKERGVLYMATEPGFAPYEYQVGDKVEGVDVDIANYIADKMGVELEIISTEFDYVISTVTSGKADLGIAGISKMPEREKMATLSDSYYESGQVILSKEGETFTSLEELEGKNVGAQIGTIGEAYATDSKVEMNIQRYKKYALAVKDLEAGVIDAIVIDKMPATKFVNTNKGLIMSDEIGELEESVIAMAKGDSDLPAFVNECLKELKEEGKIDEWVADHLTKEGVTDEE